MPNKLECILVDCAQREYPVATFIRYRGQIRSTKEYRLSGARQVLLRKAGLRLMPLSIPGSFGMGVD